MTETERYLTDRYGPHLDTTNLAELFKHPNGKSVLTAIWRGTFPIKTFRMGRLRVADVRDVARYIDEQKAASDKAA